MLAWLFGLVLFVTAIMGAAANQSVDITPTLVLPSMSGRDVFRYYCASCHGADGRGGGPAAAALKMRPADLTKLTANNTGLFPLERVKAFITHGRTGLPAHGSPEMPIWGPVFQVLDTSDTIAQARIDNVVAYLRSIQSK